MKHNLRILKLNLEIDRLRENLEDSRKRNLKLEMKAKTLFEKIKTLNELQMSSDMAKKWGKEIDDLETIMEESEIFNDPNSQREIKNLFMNMSKEIAQSLEPSETEKASDLVKNAKKPFTKAKTEDTVETSGIPKIEEVEAEAETQSEANSTEETKSKPNLAPLVEKLNKIDYSLLNGETTEETIENPIDLTSWVIDSFERKVKEMGRVLDENNASKSRSSGNRRTNGGNAELETGGNRPTDRPVY